MTSNLDALRFEQDFVRVYPNGQLLCHVLGFTNNENSGIDGMERTMEQISERARWVPLSPSGIARARRSCLTAARKSAMRATAAT
ncbi:MAG: hypothetical protein QM760_12990 [Nibricoccus sp.]